MLNPLAKPVSRLKRKTIETRSWMPPSDQGIGGRIGIHAAEKADDQRRAARAPLGGSLPCLAEAPCASRGPLR